VLAFGGRNVMVQSGLNAGGSDRTEICERLSPDGTLTLDDDVIRTALLQTDPIFGDLSCRE